MAGAATLLPQMQRDGHAVPESLAIQPVLAVSLIPYLEAFYELDTERSNAVALVRIPWSKIIAYANHYRMDEDETLYFIREMDDRYLEHLASKAPKPDGGSQGSRTVVQRPPRPD